MSSLDRDIAGKALTLTLADQVGIVRQRLAAAGDRSALTIVKQGSMRVTLVALAAGGVLESHRADGPITVQVLEGSLEFEADGHVHSLMPGSLFALASLEPHRVTSAGGSVFLLTVAVEK